MYKSKGCCLKEICCPLVMIVIIVYPLSIITFMIITLIPIYSYLSSLKDGINYKQRLCIIHYLVYTNCESEIYSIKNTNLTHGMISIITRKDMSHDVMIENI